MYLEGIVMDAVDAVRNVGYSIQNAIDDYRSKKAVEELQKEGDAEFAELRELVKYPNETIKWLRFCDVNKVSDKRLLENTEKKLTVEAVMSFHTKCCESYNGSRIAIAAMLAYMGELKEGFICWSKELRLAQSAIHKFLQIPVFPEYDDFTEEEIPDITEFSEYGNRWKIYIDDYVLSKAYDIAQQGNASKKFVSNIKTGVFMIIDSKLIEQQ